MTMGKAGQMSSVALARVRGAQQSCRIRRRDYRKRKVEYIWVGHHRENVNCYRLAYVTSRWLAVVVNDDQPMAARS